VYHAISNACELIRLNILIIYSWQFNDVCSRRRRTAIQQKFVHRVYALCVSTSVWPLGPDLSVRESRSCDFGSSPLTGSRVNSADHELMANVNVCAQIAPFYYCVCGFLSICVRYLCFLGGVRKNTAAYAKTRRPINLSGITLEFSGALYELAKKQWVTGIDACHCLAPRVNQQLFPLLLRLNSPVYVRWMWIKNGQNIYWTGEGVNYLCIWRL